MSDVSLPGLGTGITVEVCQLVGNFPEAQMLLRMFSRVSRASLKRCLGSGYHPGQQLYHEIWK